MKEQTVKQHMQEIAHLGGKAILKKHGPDYFSKLAKKAWKARKKSKSITK